MHFFHFATSTVLSARAWIIWLSANHEINRLRKFMFPLGNRCKNGDGNVLFQWSSYSFYSFSEDVILSLGIGTSWYSDKYKEIYADINKP